MGTLNQHEVRFAANVYAVRRARGMSQDDLAHAIGVGRSAVQAVEAGGRRIRLGEACDIAEALGVSLGDLISESLTIEISPSRPSPPGA